jgi:hypothetical protein
MLKEEWRLEKGDFSEIPVRITDMIVYKNNLHAAVFECKEADEDEQHSEEWVISADGRKEEAERSSIVKSGIRVVQLAGLQTYTDSDYLYGDIRHNNPLSLHKPTVRECNGNRLAGIQINNNYFVADIFPEFHMLKFSPEGSRFAMAHDWMISMFSEDANEFPSEANIAQLVQKGNEYELGEKRKLSHTYHIPESTNSPYKIQDITFPISNNIIYSISNGEKSDIRIATVVNKGSYKVLEEEVLLKMKGVAHKITGDLVNGLYIALSDELRQYPDSLAMDDRTTGIVKLVKDDGRAF